MSDVWNVVGGVLGALPMPEFHWSWLVVPVAVCSVALSALLYLVLRGMRFPFARWITWMDAMVLSVGVLAMLNVVALFQTMDDALDERHVAVELTTREALHFVGIREGAYADVSVGKSSESHVNILFLEQVYLVGVPEEHVDYRVAPIASPRVSVALREANHVWQGVLTYSPINCRVNVVNLVLMQQCDETTSLKLTGDAAPGFPALVGDSIERVTITLNQGAYDALQS